MLSNASERVSRAASAIPVNFCSDSPDEAPCFVGATYDLHCRTVVFKRHAILYCLGISLAADANRSMSLSLLLSDDPLKSRGWKVVKRFQQSADVNALE